MRTDRIAATDAFVLELPELRPLVSIDEDLIASSLRSDRGRLAHLSLRVRAAEAEVARLEGELVHLEGQDDTSLAGHGDLAELRVRIDAIRARSDADLLAARAEASARVTRAIDEATELLSSASASLDHLVEAIEGDRERALAPVVEPEFIDEPVTGVEPLAGLAVEVVAEPAPVAEPDVEPHAEPLDVPVLLSDDELESFLDRLEARVAATAMTPDAGVGS